MTVKALNRKLLASLATLALTGLGCTSEEAPMLPLTSSSQPRCTKFDDFIHLEGSFNTEARGDARRAVVFGDFLFGADGEEGVHMIGIDDPAAPVLHVTLETANDALDVAILGDVLCVGEVGGVSFWNLAASAAPTFLSQHSTPGQVRGLTVSGGLLYLVDDAAGLQILDLTDPTEPAFLGADATAGEAQDVIVVNGHAYVSDLSLGLRIADVSDPGTVVTATFPVSGQPQGIDYADGHLFIANGTEVVVVDVGIPAQPVDVGRLTLRGGVRDLLVVGERLFVTARFMGIHVLDISSPVSPIALGLVDTPGDATGMIANDEYLIVADGPGGFDIIDVTKPDPAPIRSMFEIPGQLVRATLVGDALYVCDSSSGVQIVDVSDPDGPMVAGTIDLDSPTDVVLSGDVAYIASSGRLDVFDVRDVFQPAAIGGVGAPGIEELVVHNGMLIDLNNLTGIRIYVLDDAQPALSGFLSNPPLIKFGVSAFGDYAYLAAHASGLRVIDISNPSAPQDVGGLSVGTGGLSGTALEVVVDSGFAVVGVGQHGIDIVDLQNPLAPVWVANVNTTGNPVEVAVRGQVAYIADRDGGLQVVDVRDFLNPSLLGTLHVPNLTTSVAVNENFVYTVDTNDRLVISAVHCLD